MNANLSLEAHPGLDGATLGALLATRAVALARHHEPPTVELWMNGELEKMMLEFDAPDARALTAWADAELTTYWAAEAVALEVVHARLGLGAVHRAARGSRFDWYVGHPGADLEDAVALEVGGTDRQRVESILAEKLRQIRKRADGRPGLVVAVQFRTPRAALEEA